MQKIEPLFSFDWTGTAVGNNDRFEFRSSKKLNPTYASFKESIRFACCGSIARRSPPVCSRVFLYTRMHIDPARDTDGLLKALFDGMEWDAFTKIGTIKNDNLIRPYLVDPVDKAPGEPDRIIVKAFELPKTYSIIEYINTLAI